MLAIIIIIIINSVQNSIECMCTTQIIISAWWVQSKNLYSIYSTNYYLLSLHYKSHIVSTVLNSLCGGACQLEIISTTNDDVYSGKKTCITGVFEFSSG